MTKLIYKVVQHDGGWAYRVGDTYSETFATHDDARAAANRAAREQAVGGATEVIEYEDADGHWHVEIARGGDRPEAVVDDPAAVARKP